jgi:long-chain acyl-CoA synthetase
VSRRDTLVDFFEDFSRARGTFLVHDDGYRSREYSYGEVAGAARRFATRLASAGLARGDRLVIWSENRPEWIVALWGALLRGVVVVPIDFRSSREFLVRVRDIVDAPLVLVGDDVERPRLERPAQVWALRDLLAPDGLDSARPAAGEHSPPAPEISRDDVAQIIFTSGATAEPKGVVITHRNILANIVPIEREVLKYRKYGRPFFPIRFLNLLPLSHLFGQAMATFVPPMLPGTVVFMRGYNPQEIVRQIKSRRVSVLVAVPKILDVLREHVERTYPVARQEPGRPEHWIRRWWRYREVHRALGWKFWAFVVGAAPLERPLEEFLGRLGFLVIQGYGLTETAPIVTLNHPFSTRKGTVGKPIHGVEVRIAPDGEILVRGENVTRGYFNLAAETQSAFEDGWLRTGDIGSVDAEGRLEIRGRKKEMIVTPEGLNVFPEDVERVLNHLPGVAESAVVGRTTDGEERVHAVLVLGPGGDPHAVVRQANAALADHQKIRGVTAWPDKALPRTEGTRKLRRREIRSWVEAGESDRAAGREGGGDTLEEIVARFAHGREVTGETTLDELGLSSLERVELLMALEERLQVTIDEAAYASARTVADLQRLVESPSLPSAGVAPRAVATPAEPVKFPAWNRTLPARALRRISLPSWILPLARVFARIEVQGLEHLAPLRGPVVFAANHQSHMDAPAVLSALPPRWRYRVAIAMAKEFFKAHFFPERFGRRAWLTNSLNYYLAALFFNAFPLPQREAGTRQTLRYVGQLVSEGFSILIFPEGKRTEGGEINEFRAGIGMIGARIGIPVVPVRVDGLDRILHQSWKMAKPGRARIAFGAPVVLEGEDYPALARRVEEAVRRL